MLYFPKCSVYKPVPQILWIAPCAEDTELENMVSNPQRILSTRNMSVGQKVGPVRLAQKFIYVFRYIVSENLKLFSQPNNLELCVLACSNPHFSSFLLSLPLSSSLPHIYSSIFSHSCPFLPSLPFRPGSNHCFAPAPDCKAEKDVDPQPGLQIPMRQLSLKD